MIPSFLHSALIPFTPPFTRQETFQLKLALTGSICIGEYQALDFRNKSSVGQSVLTTNQYSTESNCLALTYTPRRVLAPPITFLGFNLAVQLQSLRQVLARTTSRQYKPKKAWYFLDK